jgi:hypothetical protein
MKLGLMIFGGLVVALAHLPFPPLADQASRASRPLLIMPPPAIPPPSSAPTNSFSFAS